MAAANFFIEQGWTQPSRYFPLCIQLAGRFEQQGSQSSGEEDHSARLSPAQLLVSDKLAAWIRPDVEPLRQELFGQRHAPFSSLAEAADWIEQMARVSQFAPAHRQEVEAWVHEILQRINAYSRLGQGEEMAVAFSSSRKTLEYGTPGEKWARIVALAHGSPLIPLERACHQMTQATGFQQRALLAYILLDIAPLLPWPRVESSQWLGSLPKAGPSSRREVTVTFFHPDMTAAQWRDVRFQVRQAFSSTKHKALSEQDQQFLRIIEDMGGLPPKGKGRTAFWEAVAPECNRRLGKPYPNGQGPRRRYARLQGKIPPTPEDPRASFLEWLKSFSQPMTSPQDGVRGTEKAPDQYGE